MRTIADKIGFTFIDQIVISGSNFGLTLFLTRMLPVNEFGQYIFSFTTLVLCVGLFNSFIGTPLNILGAPVKGDDWEDILRHSLVLFGLILVLLIALLIIIALYLENTLYHKNANNLKYIAIILPFCLCQEFLRRILLTRIKLVYVIISDLITYIGRFVIALIFINMGFKTCNCILLGLGISSLFGFSIGYIFIDLSFIKSLFKIKFNSLQKIWSLSKWTFADWIPFVAYSQLYIYLVTFLLGNEANAILGACRNLIAPIVVMELGLTSYLLPFFSRRFNREGMIPTVTSALRIFIYLIIPVVIYLSVICLYSDNIIGIIYPKYLSYSYITFFFSIGIFFNFLFKMPELLILSFVRPKILFYARISAALPSVIFCYLFIDKFGLKGALFAFIFSHFIMCISVYYFFIMILSRLGKSSPCQFISGREVN